MSRQALISVGTNSTRLLVADVDGPIAIALQRSTGTRIGEGLKESGHIGEAAMRRTLEAIEEHVEAARAHADVLRVIATSAVRRANNRAEFARAVRDITGTEPATISGEEEACCSFAGATARAPRLESGMHAGVADAGGGSTEYAVGMQARCDRTVSCEIGAVRLTEALPELAGDRSPIDSTTLDRARSLVRAALRPIADFPSVDRLIFVGGSATNAVFLHRGSRDFFEYETLDREQLRALTSRLAMTALPARKTLAGMNPQRADILLAGLLLLDALFEMTGREEAMVSTSDVLLGYMVRHPLHS